MLQKLTLKEKELENGLAFCVELLVGGTEHSVLRRKQAIRGTTSKCCVSEMRGKWSFLGAEETYNYLGQQALIFIVVGCKENSEKQDSWCLCFTSAQLTWG